MNRKSPFRPNNEISQNFNSGLVKIYEVEDKAQAGYRPKPELSFTVELPFENIKLGIQRYYAAKQNQSELERVIRVPNPGPDFNISNQDIAIILEHSPKPGEKEKSYSIELVQMVEGIYPPSYDISLSRYEEEYST